MGSYLAAGLMDDPRYAVTIISGREEARLVTRHIPPDTAMVLVAVPDNAIAVVAQSLSFLKEALIVHCSGTLGLDGWAGSQRVACLWPIYSIRKEHLPKHKAVPVVICANSPKDLALLRDIATAFSDLVYILSPEQKVVAHLLAVITNNYMNHLAAVAGVLATESDIPFQLLQPIIAQTFYNISNETAVLHQTGPAIRKDSSTLARHIAMLSDKSWLQQLYKSFVASIQHFNTDNNDS